MAGDVELGSLGVFIFAIGVFLCALFIDSGALIYFGILFSVLAPSSLLFFVALRSGPTRTQCAGAD